MSIAHILRSLLIAGLLAGTATATSAGINWDPSKPLQPPTVSGSVGGTTYTLTPSPAGPAVTSNGRGDGDKLLNKAAGPATASNKAVQDGTTAINKAVQDGATAINKGIDDAGRGIGHFFNEVGMLWANFKHDMEKKAEDLWNKLKETVEGYVVWAVVALVGIIVVPVLLTSTITAWLVRRGQHPQPPGNSKVRHA